MSITYVKSKKLFDAYPQYAVDKSQISNKLSGVEYITFHNKSTFANIRVKIPAGTEITGVILCKSPRATTHAPTPNAPPDDPLQIPHNPDIVTIDWYSNFKFLNDGREDSSHGSYR